MTLAPVRVIGDYDGEINVYAFDSCIEKMNEIRQQNNEISQLKDYIKNFNEKYAVNWNKYFNKETAEFDFNEISSICDAFLSNYVEKKEMKEFKEKSGINFDELKEDCFDFFGKDFLYSFHGDKDKIYAHSDSSNILREELYFMKRRLDTDITPENEDANLKDFSRHKMLMYSGHDSTITADIILILYALGINATELYYYPRYASQLSLEVRTSKSKCSNYSDYYLLGLLDQTELFKVNAQEFIDKVGNEIWNQENVNDFCELNSNLDDNTDNYEEKKDNAKTTYKVLMSIFICTNSISIATALFFAYKYYHANKSMPPIDPKAKFNQNNVTKNSFNNMNEI